MADEYTPTDVAWFKRPLRAVVLAALLAGCGNTPTVGDFVDDWAASTCSRQIRCGWTTAVMNLCELEVRQLMCEAYDCGHPYEPSQIVLDCIADYAEASCSDPIPICKFP